MKLTKNAQYALIALKHLRTHEEQSPEVGGQRFEQPLKIQEISEIEGISVNFLEQIFRKLRQAGIVRSIRGPGGGYVVNKPSITFNEIFKAVGEKIEVGNVKGETPAIAATAELLASTKAILTENFERLTI